MKMKIVEKVHSKVVETRCIDPHIHIRYKFLSRSPRSGALMSIPLVNEKNLGGYHIIRNILMVLIAPNRT